MVDSFVSYINWVFFFISNLSLLVFIMIISNLCINLIPVFLTKLSLGGTGVGIQDFPKIFY